MQGQNLTAQNLKGQDLKGQDLKGQAAKIDSAALDELLTTRQSKWNLTIVLHIRRETKRFTELQRDIGVISQKALTSSLRTLERDGFVLRTSYATIPPRVDYALTSLGVEALKAFEAFEAFAASHWQSVVEARRQFDARTTDIHPAIIHAGN